MIYADTSFLLSLYIPDSWSLLASEQIVRANQPLVWTLWHELEMVTALEAKRGRKWVTDEQAKQVELLLEQHLLEGLLVSQDPQAWRGILRRSIELGRESGARHLSRSLDVVHVALALELGREQFWSFDERQRALALEKGLELNPLRG